MEMNEIDKLEKNANELNTYFSLILRSEKKWME